MLTQVREVNIFWFRRDLRLDDNAGLYHALKSNHPVLPVFIFDKLILDQLGTKTDRRVAFIHTALEKIQLILESLGSSLRVFYGTPEEAFTNLISTYNISQVFTNHDYEPYAVERDKKIKELLSIKNIKFHSFKDHVIFEKDEVLKDDRKPYTIFTPYSRKWKALINSSFPAEYNCNNYFHNFFKQKLLEIPSLNEIGFNECKNSFPSETPDKELISQYARQRDFPGIAGTSRMGVHLRFGTLSIRQLVSTAKDISDKFLGELIWRDFYQSILWHFPRIGQGYSFKPQYDHIEWRRDNGEFDKWCNGQTGYPIVDAGMRELNATGFMHNRVRMITASFLCKHLLLDWRMGEAYFAEKLLDFDFASNNGGWQWASGSGCDSAPYFRIFNPSLQMKKFDPKFEYVKKWVPEFQEFTYPKPIVDHDFARKRCLEVYSKSLRTSEH